MEYKMNIRSLVSLGISALGSSFSVASPSLSKATRPYSIKTITEKVNDIFVIGAGCIGQGLAISLLKSNPSNRVFLLTRSQYIHNIQKSGIRSNGAVAGVFVPNARFVVVDKVDDQLFRQRQIQNNPIIFSATKASDAVSSLFSFYNMSNIDPAIICLQNGLGSEQEVQKSLSQRQGAVLKGHVLGAVHKKDGDLFAYKGKILIERRNDSLSEKLSEIFQDSDQGIFSMEISQNIYRDIFPKIAVNCVCNPLTIILNQNLGFIRNHHEPIIRLICEEIYNVAISQGVELTSSQHLADFVLDMMSKYSSHYSSMYLDHVAGKETEIDYINGGIIKIADANGVEAPINRLLTNAVKEIQQKRKSAKSAEEFYQMNVYFLKELTLKFENFLKAESINILNEYCEF